MTAKAQHLTDYVDPYIGSGGHGHVFVGASVPFGAVQLGPNNFFKGWDWDSGYNYGDSIVIGFSHLHLNGTGIGDLGDILIMPYTGPVRTDKATEQHHEEGYGSLYDHRDEKVKPGYYAVKLKDYGISVELTATERVGFHRYHFPEGKEAHVIIDLKEGTQDQATETYIKQVDDHTLEGYRFSRGWAKDQREYFAIRSSLPLQQFDVYDNDQKLDGKEGKGNAIKGLISFEKAPATLELKVGLSPVSAEGALANIEAEAPGWDFDQVARQADKKWEKELAKISIKTNNDTEKRVFYTALYHTMIDPCLFNDHNRDYRGADKQVVQHAAFDNYSVFSLWDIYRAAFPLYILTQPGRVNDMINTMLAIYDQQGSLPIWHLMGNETGTMVGISSLQIIADAYLKGYKGFGAQKAFADIKATATMDKLGLDYVKNLQPIPCDRNRESVARALEYAVSDGSIALMAKQTGNMQDYAYFMKRAHNYTLYYDKQTGFFRGRRADGSWNPGFDPVKSYRPWSNDYTEGNAWQYLWLVPQDVPGLIRLLGGEQTFTQRLDTFFSLAPQPDPHALADLTGNIGQYAHGNEPGHHTAYLYAFGGQQWKTAEKVRYIMHEFYKAAPDGIIGNEDCGQMSAWYVFSSLGFYPVFPASGKYVLGSPLFDEATLHLKGGKTFTVRTVNNGPANMYIQRIRLNGKDYTKSYITYGDMVKGGALQITMGNKPNPTFGQRQEDRPE